MQFEPTHASLKLRRGEYFYRFFGSFCLLKGSDNFKFFFGGNLLMKYQTIPDIIE